MPCCGAGGRLRRNALEKGGVAPVGASSAARDAMLGMLSGQEERFAFGRAVSRLYEMQSEQYRMASERHRRA